MERETRLTRLLRLMAAEHVVAPLNSKRITEAVQAEIANAEDDFIAEPSPT